MSKLLKALFVSFLAAAAWGQMPHELLLLVNRQSQDSLRAANYYVATRQIPASNVVYLDVPKEVYGGTATLTPEQFAQLIWEPANRVARQRGIADRILAWVYSVDFPIRVRTDGYDRKQMSVSGLTFTRGRVPDLDLVEKGQYVSKLFAGPSQAVPFRVQAMALGTWKRGLGPEAELPEGLEWLRAGAADEMPLPSMHLGYTGEKGTDIETVLATIARGVQADHLGQKNGIYFITSDDVRSTCRARQYQPAVEELAARGITAEITTKFPPEGKFVMGLMMGAEEVDPSKVSLFAPGAVAEHLTSWSAEFQKRQTKMTEWLKAGACGSAGTVVEPYSNPNKFPSARFYVMYASGCTMLESFYQSIACPLQNLLIGDPLARPYAYPINVKLLGVDKLKDDFTFLATAGAPMPEVEYEYAFLLDDKDARAFSDGNSLRLRVASVSDGWHELRVVARAKHRVGFSATTTKSIVVDARGRAVRLVPAVRKLGRHEHAMRVEVEAGEKPAVVRLVSGARVLDEKTYTDQMELVLDELMVGEGPNRVRAVAVYADGMEVSSEPVNCGITFDE